MKLNGDLAVVKTCHLADLKLVCCWKRCAINQQQIQQMLVQMAQHIRGVQ